MRRYRRGLQVGLLMVIAAFIASLFVFGQRGFGDGAGRDAVATVNAEAIPLARYQQRYQAFTASYVRIYRGRSSPERRRATSSSGSTWPRFKTSSGSPSDAGSSP